MAATISHVTNVAPGLPGGISSAIDITAAVVVKVGPGILASISVIAAGSSGSLAVNDTTSVGGAGATNAICSIPFSALSAGRVLKLNWPCASGITISAVPVGSQFVLAFS